MSRRILPRFTQLVRQQTSITQYAPRVIYQQIQPASRRAATRHHEFHTSRILSAQHQSADAVMEELTDLYSTAKDEFEIAAEETEKKTVHASEDREAAKEALAVLKEAYEKAVRESSAEVAKEVQTRTGPRIKELENALTAVEEMAMED